MDYAIVSIKEEHLNGFWSAVDSVARERQYLAFLQGPPIEATKEFILNQINNHWPQFVAIQHDKVIGWCDISPLDRPVFAHSGSLGIGVIAEYRGLGIGRALITAALHAAKKKGLTRIELTVREHNTAAINLYKQCGFVTEGVHKNAVCIDGAYEHHVFMALLWY